MKSLMEEALFTTWKTSRKLYAAYFEKYNLKQLNAIPAGFNNNLIWNIGHVIVAQQSLIYKGANLPWHISDELVERYKPGSRPEGDVSQDEASELNDLLLSLIDQTIADVEADIFKTYNQRMTGTGFYLKDVAHAFEFNNYHEGLHLGCMKGIERFV